MRLPLIPLPLTAFALGRRVIQTRPWAESFTLWMVVDGDTFDVQLGEHDSRLSEDVIRIRLADIDCPESRGLH